MVQSKAVILCVDDEANPLALRKLVLQKAGYEVVTANSAKEALALAATRSFDLVLSDYLMPGTTGTELAQKLKAEHPRLPVILISGVNELPAGSTDRQCIPEQDRGPRRPLQGGRLSAESSS